ASIPLSILSSIAVLGALGETINIMTLGGLALAVGILVDDATVTIENINRYLEEGKERDEAILDGAAQIAVPAFVSTLAICIVFVPMFLLSGVARYLFVPLAEAVVFAMLASYILSRTLVPTLAMYLLRSHREGPAAHEPRQLSAFGRVQARFEVAFEGLRERYRNWLARCLARRARFLVGFGVISLLSLGVLVPFLGRDFFPSVDSGQFLLHVRARTGTRIEETARLCDQVEQFLRQELPAQDVGSIIDNIGLPYSGINLSYSNSAPIGPSDADVLVSLKESGRTDEYVHQLRLDLPGRFPGVTFAFLAPDIVSQILNFGLPAPIDVQIAGQDQAGNRKVADRLLADLHGVLGVSDLRIQQPADQPQLHIAVDRTKASQLGITQRDVASNLLVSLSGSSQTQPSFWLNRKNGVSYAIATQTPQYWIDNLQDLETIGITSAGAPAAASGELVGNPDLMASLANIQRGAGQAVVSHYDIQPVIDIFGSTYGRDLGAVASDIDRLVERARHDLPRGSQITVRGQIQTMRSSYLGLLAGLAFAIVLIYLLIVVNFQSWRDPFVIIAA
ncbi:MAG TPA: efflux RND transporter permease subunit, partial [Polyangiaceae bacterium]|nr:efflux RND transporter permease subunit [Polyangiaceae bacterium]